jgi:REP element-mobilizing transposase RayT
MARTKNTGNRRDGIVRAAARHGSDAPRRRPRRPRQLALELRTHGGRRAGAGRKPKGAKAGVTHHGREALTGREPVHVTLRVAARVRNLRSRRCFAAFEAALAAVRRRADEFRVVHYSLQSNHVHLVVEAASRSALSNGMNALAARFARGLNAMMGTRGEVFPDRYHSRVLRTPREVRSAVAYAVGNLASHARRRGDEAPHDADPYSSIGCLAPALLAPRTWLLRSTVRRAEPG